MKREKRIKVNSWAYGTGSGRSGFTASKIAEAFLFLGGRYVPKTYPLKVIFNKPFSVRKNDDGVIIETEDAIVYVECFFRAT